MDLGVSEITVTWQCACNKVRVLHLKNKQNSPNGLSWHYSIAFGTHNGYDTGNYCTLKKEFGVSNTTEFRQSIVSRTK